MEALQISPGLPYAKRLWAVNKTSLPHKVLNQTLGHPTNKGFECSVEQHNRQSLRCLSFHFNWEFLVTSRHYSQKISLSLGRIRLVSQSWMGFCCLPVLWLNLLSAFRASLGWSKFLGRIQNQLGTGFSSFLNLLRAGFSLLHLTWMGNGLPFGSLWLRLTSLGGSSRRAKWCPH